jgi:hypothetical protein
MIYFFTGSATERVRAQAFRWVRAAQTKEPELVYRRLVRTDLAPGVLEDVATSGGLFVQRLLTLLDEPFTTRIDDEAAPSEVEEMLSLLASSNNVFVILAPGLSSARTKRVSALATKTYTFDRTEPKIERGFNAGLVNALAEKRRERLWLELTRALRAGDAPEMLHGLLHWKARDLMKKGSRVWSHPEARTLSLTLIMLLQESRRTGLELSLALERFVLSL